MVNHRTSRQHQRQLRALEQKIDAMPLAQLPFGIATGFERQKNLVKLEEEEKVSSVLEEKKDEMSLAQLRVGIATGFERQKNLVKLANARSVNHEAEDNVSSDEEDDTDDDMPLAALRNQPRMPMALEVGSITGHCLFDVLDSGGTPIDGCKEDMYKVRWTGYREQTWEPATSFCVDDRNHEHGLFAEYKRANARFIRQRRARFPLQVLGYDYARRI
jgi:hypothetical protein